MEVTVLNADNLPSKCVLTLQVGSVRRQAAIEPGLPIVIPHPGASSCKIDVAVMRQLGSQTLPGDGKIEAECTIPAQISESKQSQVRLQTRLTNPGGADANAATKVDDAGVTKNYLDQHQLQFRIQGLIQDVLREQPDNPFRYMMETLKKQHAQGQSVPANPLLPNAAAAPPAGPPPVPAAAPAPEPRPPAEPKPAKSRPVPKAGLALPAGAEKKGRHPLTAAVVGLLLRTEACQEVAKASLRMAQVKQTSTTIGERILINVRSTIVDRLVQCVPMPGDRSQARIGARASLALVWQNSVIFCSPEYKQALTRWSLGVAFRGASNIIGADEERSAANFDPKGSHRRMSVPTPFVSLGCDPSWGAMLR